MRFAIRFVLALAILMLARAAVKPVLEFIFAPLGHIVNSLHPLLSGTIAVIAFLGMLYLISKAAKYYEARAARRAARHDLLR